VVLRVALSSGLHLLIPCTWDSKKTFESHSQNISCVDISVDNTLLASGSEDRTARIWNLTTGKLVAGPFGESEHGVSAVRFSPNSTKLAVKRHKGTS
jgi:WD40 repeat protein